MHLQKLYKLLGLLLWTLGWVSCGCYDPTPAFPLPKLDGKITELEQAFTNIKASIERTVSATEYDTTSFSFEVTSSKSTLFALYHTAKHQDPSRPGASSVNGTSAYRIASCTKVFTVLAILQQHAKGALHLDDAVNKYLPELEEKQSGTLPWHDITLRALGSQLSGIPGDLLQVDLINSRHNPEDLGLPPKSRKGLPTCGEYASFTKICEKDDLIRELRKGKPTFAPAQQSSYCNVGFEILGLVLEKVTKQPYSEYIHSMLKELNIEGIKFDKPADGIAVLPANETSYWDVEMGVQNPSARQLVLRRTLSLTSEQHRRPVQRLFRPLQVPSVCAYALQRHHHWGLELATSRLLQLRHQFLLWYALGDIPQRRYSQAFAEARVVRDQRRRCTRLQLDHHDGAGV